MYLAQNILSYDSKLSKIVLVYFKNASINMLKKLS
jgi:hypothetical protein